MENYIIENENWVFKFYTTKEATTVSWDLVQIKDLKMTKTIDAVSAIITDLEMQKTRKQEQTNKEISLLDLQIAKQQEYINIMV